MAVFLGFIAENIRENIVEKERAKEYAFSLVNDLESDKKSIQEHISFRESIYKNADSLLDLLKAGSFYADTSKTSKYFFRMITRSIMATHEGTIRQLESSGSLRLFRNKKFVTALMNYYNLLDQANSRIQYLFDYEMQTLLPFEQEHYDLKYNDTIYRLQNHVQPFRKIDEEAEIELYNMTFIYGGLNRSLANRVLPGAIRQADSLILQCKNEFHLENE